MYVNINSFSHLLSPNIHVVKNRNACNVFLDDNVIYMCSMIAIHVIACTLIFSVVEVHILCLITILGPMVYGTAFCPLSKRMEVKELGVAGKIDHSSYLYPQRKYSICPFLASL